MPTPPLPSRDDEPVPHGEGEGVVVWRYPNCGQWGGLVLPGDAKRDPSHVNYAAEYRAIPVIPFNAMSAYANTGEEVEWVLIEANLDDAETTPAETVRLLIARANTATVAADLMRARAERAEALLKEARDGLKLDADERKQQLASLSVARPGVFDALVYNDAEIKRNRALVSRIDAAISTQRGEG